MVWAIDVQGLQKSYGNHKAVEDFTLRLPYGQVIGLLGPNGSGKSTSIKMLCGVTSPSGGTGKVLGININHEGAKIKNKIGYMSQKFSLYPDLTVEENLDFYAGIHNLSHAKAQARKRELLEMADLKGKETQLAGTLSGGWKQRMALACAIVHEPKLLFLDEPTAGVDPQSRKIFWNLVNQIVMKGAAALVTTHYLEETKNCNIIGFMLQGQLKSVITRDRLLEITNEQALEDYYVGLTQEG